VKRQLVVLPLLAAALLVNACSNPSVVGTPSANPTTANQSSGGSATSGNSSSSGDPLASVNSCSLLTSAQINQYQLQKVSADTENGARDCSWQGAVGPSPNGGGIDIAIYDTAGISQLNSGGYTITDYPVGKHQGRLYQSNDGGGLCAVSIAITSTSRVDVGGQGGTGQQSDSCGIAKQFAPMVEQNLVALGD
jgi:hypothetical protein